MAYEFPRYLSKGRASTDQPSHFAPENTEGQQLEQVAKVGQTAQNMTFKMAEAYNEAQKTQAEFNQRTQNDDLIARAEADPDYNAYQKYAQENDKIKKESISGFKNNDGEAIAKANYYANTTDNQLQGIFRKKMIDNQQANLLGLLDKDASSGNMDSIKSRIEKNKELGFIGALDAKNLEDKYIKQAKQNSFLTDVNYNIDEASQNLKENKYGFNVDEMEKAKSILERSKNKSDEAFKNAQMQTVNAAGELLAKKELTVNQIENWVTAGVMDADMAVNFELALANPDDWSAFAKEQDQGAKSKMLTGLLEKVNADDVDERMKIVDSALQNFNDKKIDSNDLAFVLRVAAGKSKDPQNPIWGFLKSAINGTPTVMKSSAGVMEKFMSRWDFQEDPREVMKQAAVDQYKEDKPETASFKAGDVIKRKSGSYEVTGFNEDGSPVFRKK